MRCAIKRFKLNIYLKNKILLVLRVEMLTFCIFFCSTFYMLSCYIIFNYYNLFIRQSNLRSQMWQNAWCCQFKSLENVWVAGAEEHSWSCSFDCMVSSVPSSGECVAAVHLNQSIDRAGWMAGISCRLDANSLLYLEHFLPLRQSPEVHTTSESEQRLDWEIQSAVDKAVRDFVSSWYCSSVSKGGDEFEWEVRDAMLEAATELKRRAKQVDRRALAQRVLELADAICRALAKPRNSSAHSKTSMTKRFQNYGELRSQKLWRLYSSSDLPHPALTGPAKQLCYTRALVDVLMHVLISKSHLETRTGRYMVGELITCNVVLTPRGKIIQSRLVKPDHCRCVHPIHWQRRTKPS